MELSAKETAKKFKVVASGEQEKDKEAKQSFTYTCINNFTIKNLPKNTPLFM